MLGAFEVPQSQAPSVIKVAGSTYWVWADIGNGGLYQYFYNSAYGLPVAVESLRVLERERAADILAGAIGLLPSSSMLHDKEARRSFVERGDTAERLDAFNDDFWDAFDEETFFDDLAAYVRAHRADFVPYLSGEGA
jgi:hypothetical protein